MALFPRARRRSLLILALSCILASSGVIVGTKVISHDDDAGVRETPAAVRDDAERAQRPSAAAEATASTAPQADEPQNTDPDSAAPDAATPDGTAPEGSAPKGSAPKGSAPDNSAPPAPVATPAPVVQPAPAPAPAVERPAAAPSPAGPPADTTVAKTVGVPAGTQLTVHNGDLTITTPGAIIDGLDIRGFVRVEAPGVTIKNTVIRGRATNGDAIMLYAGLGNSSGLRVIDSEIAPTHQTARTNGVYGYDFTLTRVDIHHIIDAVHIFGDNVTVENSRLRDNLHYASDAAHGGGPSHDDSIQIQSGRNIRIVGNTISGAYNAAIQITQDRGLVSNVTITGNTISGGGCTINVAEKGKGAIVGLTIDGNTFGSSRFNCNIVMPSTTTLAGAVSNSVLGGGTVTLNTRAQ